MSWIQEKTNRSEEYWVARVQALISENTKSTEDGHGETDEQWIHQLVDEIVSNLPPDETYDGNMRMAALLSYVLGLWYASVHLAKMFDSNRPTFVRQRAFQNLQDWKTAMFESMTDISKLPTYFMGQPWQHPFDPEAKGGDFL